MRKQILLEWNSMIDYRSYSTSSSIAHDSMGYELI